MKITITKQFQDFIKGVGLSLDEILQKARIPNILWKDELELSAEQYYHFLEIVGEEVTDEQILAMSDIRSMQMFLPMFYAALCSANGLDGLKRFAAYKKIIGPIQIDVTENEKDVVITMTPTLAGQKLPRMLLLNEQLLMVSLLRTGIGKEIKPIRVEGPFEYGECLKEYLGITPYICNENRLVFDRQQLKSPFITHNNIMLEYMEPELKKRLAALENDYSFLSMVQKTLYTAISADHYSIEEIAYSMGLSVRTLQRMLKENGYTFKLMVQKVQQTLAENYLCEGNLTIDDISILVGYQNTVSFLRAFKSWTGLTVTQYREKIRSEVSE